MNQNGANSKTDADRLRELIAQAGLSQMGFAREIDVAPRTVRYWVGGALRVPRYALIAAEHLALCAPRQN